MLQLFFCFLCEENYLNLATYLHFFLHLRLRHQSIIFEVYFWDLLSFFHCYLHYSIIAIILLIINHYFLIIIVFLFVQTLKHCHLCQNNFQLTIFEKSDLKSIFYWKDANFLKDSINYSNLIIFYFFLLFIVFIEHYSL